MDVHPPHKPVHSVKEFLIHMLAITLGLIIALGMESAVAYFHHRHLAGEARENILSELRDNQQAVDKYAGELPGQMEYLSGVLVSLDAGGSSVARAKVRNYKWSVIQLYDSSWNAASSTGATGYMQYAEVKRYDRIYSAQRLLMATFNRSLEQRNQVFAVLSRYNAGPKLSAAEIEQAKQVITTEIVLLQELNEMDAYLNRAYAGILKGGN